MSEVSKKNSTKFKVALLIAIWVAFVVFQIVSTFFNKDEQSNCFRALECVRQDELDIPFKPHYVWDRPSYGDLGNMVGLERYQIKQRQRFTTDEYGFRNPLGTLDNCCDVVVVGDSFAIGVKTSDEDIFSAQLRREAELRVYNYSSEPLKKFLVDTRFVEHKPKWLILLYVERNLEEQSLGYEKLASTYSPQRFRNYAEYEEARSKLISVERTIKGNLENIRSLSRYMGRIFKETLYDLGLWGLPSTIYYLDPERKMLFYSEKIEKKFDTEATSKKIDSVIGSLQRYAADLKNMQIQLLTVIIPDKETVYHELVPSLRSLNITANLDYFCSEAEKAGLNVVRAHEALFTFKVTHPGQWLYHLDDTHINGVGFNVVAKAVAKKLNEIEKSTPP